METVIAVDAMGSDRAPKPEIEGALQAARNFPGVRVLLVDSVSKEEVGGQSREQTRVCLIAYRKDVGELSRMLAHEFGHLLGLPHPDRPANSGPGNEKVMADWSRNLMHAGSLNPDALLTPAQVKLARSSNLASRFGGINGSFQPGLQSARSLCGVLACQ